jgi:hypothetical protein
LFGTLASDPPMFNRRGYANALWRFGDLIHSPGVQSCGKPLSHSKWDECPTQENPPVPAGGF